MVTSPLLPVAVGEDVVAGEMSPRLSVETVTELRLGEVGKAPDISHASNGKVPMRCSGAKVSRSPWPVLSIQPGAPSFALASLAAAMRGELVVIDLMDDGPGIPAERLQENDRTVRAARSGAGRSVPAAWASACPSSMKSCARTAARRT
ncbi:MULTISPECIES: hypothetical protein [unclassified Caballeronia]|uniref:hypothetical protein n=1 Tax=unclassified Caballeronia TaxID=2646786 RepID=UPI00285DB7E4|nr:MULTISPECIES: hypothetical protein [unclassified Caballeronia]MDR5752466.1 hypothetical protein [Caballeronia sp. LZ024]MDR5845272.1 hypothetical protein [Caballeronia sp. LZ031]